jgi:Spy/CpxP family protein refolding chaperone
MTFKFIPALASAIGFTVGVTIVGGMAKNASAIPVQLPIAQEQRLPKKPMRGSMPLPKPMPALPELMGIDLTPQQQEQIQQVTQEMHQRVQAVVPPPPQPTAEQQQKIQQIMLSYRQKVEEVLTPEQREQLNQQRNNFGGIKPIPVPSSVLVLPPPLSQLDLSTQQQEQIKKINQDMAAQMQDMLPKPRELSQAQKTQLQELMQSYRQKVQAILTPEQQQQLRQNIQKFQQFRRDPKTNQTR